MDELEKLAYLIPSITNDMLEGHNIKSLKMISDSQFNPILMVKYINGNIIECRTSDDIINFIKTLSL
jgi:hypothetical protein